MKLTIEQIKQIIKEEIAEVYKGKDRIIYAPDASSSPREKGSYILPSKDPYDQLDPMVKEKIPSDAPDDLLRQAYELSSMLGDEPEDDVEDFIKGIKLSNDPETARQEAMEELRAEMEKTRAYARSLPRGPERAKIARKVNSMLVSLGNLKYSKDLESVYKE